MCEHLYLDEDDELLPAYTWTYPDGRTELMCDDCASMSGFCVYCFAYTGDDMSVPEEEQEAGWEHLEHGSVFSFGTVRVCDKCAGLE